MSLLDFSATVDSSNTEAPGSIISNPDLGYFIIPVGSRGRAIDSLLAHYLGTGGKRHPITGHRDVILGPETPYAKNAPRWRTYGDKK